MYAIIIYFDENEAKQENDKVFTFMKGKEKRVYIISCCIVSISEVLEAAKKKETNFC